MKSLPIRLPGRKRIWHLSLKGKARDTPDSICPERLSGREAGRWNEKSFYLRGTQVLAPALQVTFCVTLGKWFPLLSLQFPHCSLIPMMKVVGFSPDSAAWPQSTHLGFHNPIFLIWSSRVKCSSVTGTRK